MLENLILPIIFILSLLFLINKFLNLKYGTNPNQKLIDEIKKLRLCSDSQNIQIKSILDLITDLQKIDETKIKEITTELSLAIRATNKRVDAINLKQLV